MSDSVAIAIALRDLLGIWRELPRLFGFEWSNVYPRW
jgi:hypothetical protein